MQDSAPDARSVTLSLHAHARWHTAAFLYAWSSALQPFQLCRKLAQPYAAFALTLHICGNLPQLCCRAKRTVFAFYTTPGT